MFDTVFGVPLAGVRSAALVEPEGEFVFAGWDFTGATFRLEVRDRRNGGELRAALDTVATAAEEGVRIASVEMVEGLPVTTLRIRINETTMEAMPEPDPGEDAKLFWGLHVTPAGGIKFQAFDGPFTVKASAVE